MVSVFPGNTFHAHTAGGGRRCPPPSGAAQGNRGSAPAHDPQALGRVFCRGAHDPGPTELLPQAVLNLAGEGLAPRVGIEACVHPAHGEGRTGWARRRPRKGVNKPEDKHADGLEEMENIKSLLWQENQGGLAWPAGSAQMVAAAVAGAGFPPWGPTCAGSSWRRSAKWSRTRPDARGEGAGAPLQLDCTDAPSATQRQAKGDRTLDEQATDRGLGFRRRCPVEKRI